MIGLLGGLGLKFYIWIGGVLLVIALCTGLYFSIREGGKDSVRFEQTKGELKQVDRANEIEDSVNRAKPDDVIERLRKWQRD